MTSRVFLGEKMNDSIALRVISLLKIFLVKKSGTAQICKNHFLEKVIGDWFGAETRNYVVTALIAMMFIFITPASAASIQITPDPKAGSTVLIPDGATSDKFNDFIDYVQIRSLGGTDIEITTRFYAASGGFTSTSGLHLVLWHYDGVTWTQVQSLPMTPVDFTVNAFNIRTINFTVPSTAAFGTNYIRAALIDRASATDVMTGYFGTLTGGTAGGTSRHFDNVDVDFSVLDNVAPVISLNGGTNMVMVRGEPFVESGYSAIDNIDGDVTANVAVTGSVDIYTSGIYTLTYDVSDAAGNAAIQQTRQVTVQENWQPVLHPTPPNNYRAIVNGNGLYVMVGSAGTILTSVDGASWTHQFTGTDADLQDIIWTGVSNK